MGYFGHWVVVAGAGLLRLRRLGLEPAREEATPGWRYAWGEDIPDDFDSVVERAARAGSGVALGVWVFDSDYAQVVGVAGGSVSAAVAVNHELAEAPMAHDPAAFSAWSEHAPTPLTAADVEEILARDDVFAEETVDELFDRLGLPTPYDPREVPARPFERPPPATSELIGAEGLGGYVEPLAWMHETGHIRPVDLPWRELRHVPGIGDGFLGIWDRESPGEPVATFPVSARGEARLREELERLQVPLEIEVLRADGLGGFVEPVALLPEVRVAERDLWYRDSRFLPGRGDGFVGIWDRERPEEPIERFPPGRAGEDAAGARVYRLLFDLELGRKQTPGLRRYLRPGKSELVRMEVPPMPDGLSKSQREAFEWVASQGIYQHTSTEPWLLVEEDDDEHWRVLFSGEGRLYLYSVGGYGEELSCRGRFESIEEADAAAERQLAGGDWDDVPASVPRTLMATLRWAQRELTGAAAGPWYERYDWIDSALEPAGTRSFARVFEDGVPVAVVVAAELGYEGEPAAYLLRPDDGPRLVYTLDRLDLLTAMLGNYLGDVELGEWRSLPESWPRDLARLGPAVLVLAGLQ